MQEDILDKINQLLNKHGTTSELKLYKEDAVTILELLERNVAEDRILLRALKRYTETSWSSSNQYINECMEDILAYYGIIEKKGIDPKMIIEKRGSCVIKKQIEIDSLDDIKGILEK